MTINLIFFIKICEIFNNLQFIIQFLTFENFIEFLCLHKFCLTVSNKYVLIYIPYENEVWTYLSHLNKELAKYSHHKNMHNVSSLLNNNV